MLWRYYEAVFYSERVLEESAIGVFESDTSDAATIDDIITDMINGYSSKKVLIINHTLS